MQRIHRRAFTLIELLTVIAIIGILGALIITGVGSAKRSAQRAGGVNALRQTGTAIELYAQDHQGTLPGPLWPGQVPIYQPDRGEFDGRLVGFLAPYLDIRSPDNRPMPVEVLIPPAFPFDEMYQDPSDEPRTFVMNTAPPPGQGGGRPPGPGSKPPPLNLWGTHPALAKDPSQTQPAKRYQVPDPANTWAMMDADQLNPRVKGAPWASSTPEKPIHDGVRHVLFLDGRVDSVDAEQGLP